MFNQIELFFVNPSIMSVSHQILMGHFTSNRDFKHEGCFDLYIKTDGEKVKNVFATSEVVYENLVFSDYANSGFDNEMNFLNSPSLNALMGSKKLKTYSGLMNEKDMLVQVCFLQVPSLNENKFSYLFFGFVNNKVVEKIHSKVFFTDRDGNVHEGNEVKHKMGNNISTHFIHNYSFGFGKNIALSSTSSKDYLEGLAKYKKIKLSGENLDTEMQKKLKMVYAFYDEDFFKYLSVFTKLMKENGLSENLDFWVSKDYNETVENLSKKAIVEIKEF